MRQIFDGFGRMPYLSAEAKMTTLAITIGHACTGCNECEKIIPGLREEVSKRGSILASPYNPNVPWERITDALQACAVGAIGLEQV